MDVRPAAATSRRSSPKRPGQVYEIGTLPGCLYLGLLVTVRPLEGCHEAVHLGGRKARLAYLHGRWLEHVADTLGRVELHPVRDPSKAEDARGIAADRLRGIDGPASLDRLQRLQHVGGRDLGNVHGAKRGQKVVLHPRPHPRRILLFAPRLDHRREPPRGDRIEAPRAVNSGLSAGGPLCLRTRILAAPEGLPGLVSQPAGSLDRRRRVGS